jgi:hypothetical protein
MRAAGEVVGFSSELFTSRMICNDDTNAISVAPQPSQRTLVHLMIDPCQAERYPPMNVLDLPQDYA